MVISTNLLHCLKLLIYYGCIYKQNRDFFFLFGKNRSQIFLSDSKGRFFFEVKLPVQITNIGSQGINISKLNEFQSKTCKIFV